MTAVARDPGTADASPPRRRNGDRGRDVNALIGAADGADGVLGSLRPLLKTGGIGTSMVQAVVRAGARKFDFFSVYHPSLAALSNNHRNKQSADAALYDSDLGSMILQPAIPMG